MNYFVKLEQLNQLKSFSDTTIYTNNKYYTIFSFIEVNPWWRVHLKCYYLYYKF